MSHYASATPVYAHFGALTDSYVPSPQQQQQQQPGNTTTCAAVTSASVPQKAYSKTPISMQALNVTRYGLIFLRLFQATAAMCLLSGSLFVSNMNQETALLCRVPPAFAIIHSVYSIYHFSGSHRTKTPITTVNYLLIATVIDIALTALYAYSGVLTGQQYDLGNAMTWQTIFSSDNNRINRMTVLSLFIISCIAGGLSLITMGIDGYFIRCFRILAELPPTQNPFAQDYIYYQPMATASEKDPKLRWSASTVATSDSTLIPVNTNDTSSAAAPLMVAPRQVAFLDSRSDGRGERILPFMPPPPTRDSDQSSWMGGEAHTTDDALPAHPAPEPPAPVYRENSVPVPESAQPLIPTSPKMPKIVTSPMQMPKIVTSPMQIPTSPKFSTSPMMPTSPTVALTPHSPTVSEKRRTVAWEDAPDLPEVPPLAPQQKRKTWGPTVTAVSSEASTPSLAQRLRTRTSTASAATPARKPQSHTPTKSWDVKDLTPSPLNVKSKTSSIVGSPSPSPSPSNSVRSVTSVKALAMAFESVSSTTRRSGGSVSPTKNTPASDVGTSPSLSPAGPPRGPKKKTKSWGAVQMEAPATTATTSARRLMRPSTAGPGAGGAESAGRESKMRKPSGERDNHPEHGQAS